MKLNYAKLLIINYLFIMCLELLFKLLVIKTYDIGIFYICINSFAIANVITFLTYLFKNNVVNKIVSLIIYTTVTLIYAAEIVYFSFYKTICGISALLYGTQVMEFYTAILEHIKNNILLLIDIFILLLIIYVIIFVSKKTYYKNNFKDAFALLIVSFIFCISSLELNITNNENIRDLVYNKNDLMQSTNNLGILSSVSMDAFKLVGGFEENIEFDSVIEFTKDDNVEYNMVNIDFDALISSEKDSVINGMHNYFKSEEPTNKNEYTGIFAGKNLIFIVAEGFYPIAVSEELTPTLYKLTNSSFVFENYYQPIYNCSTSDGEFINQLSILPGVATCSMKETIGKYYPYNVGEILPNYGYKANAFHGWTYNYYSRDKVLPNLGYTYYGYDRYKRGYKYALKGIKDSWPTSDIDVINSSYDIYSQEERFVTYYMSISGHLEYNFNGGNAIAKKNKEEVKSVNAKNSIKAYIATQIEFDKSLELLLAKLESDGILDDTVIVISPDHYPYGLSTSDIKSYVDFVDNENFDLYKNNLIIYNSELKTTNVSKYTSSLDLLPTLLNLFGVEYDSRLLIGKDIFSSSEDLVIFNNKSWITSVGRYDYLKKKFENFTDEEVPQSYIDETNKIVDMKFQISKLLISKDYYRKLGGL
ncbi:MAG: LTA synthase family protein [Erysipelotrichales bacterium]|nr:LTA synthase family protein [Erysipelotrichales bacterium]